MKLELNRKGVALGLVVGLIGGAAGGALATTGGSKATTTTTTTTATAPGKAVVDAFLADVAGRLGVDVSKLTDALKGAAADQVDQAVKDGKLTQAQADAIKQRIQSGDLGRLGLGLGRGFFPGKGPGGPGFGFGIGKADLLGAAAGYLGLTEAQLETQLQSGKSLADVANATSGKSVSGLEDALTAAANEAIDASGLTADQKTALKAKVKTMVDALVTRTPGAGPLGGHMFGRGDMPMQRGMWR